MVLMVMIKEKLLTLVLRQRYLLLNLNFWIWTHTRFYEMIRPTTKCRTCFLVILYILLCTLRSCHNAKYKVGNKPLVVFFVVGVNANPVLYFVLQTWWLTKGWFDISWKKSSIGDHIHIILCWIWLLQYWES